LTLRRAGRFRAALLDCPQVAPALHRGFARLLLTGTAVTFHGAFIGVKEAMLSPGDGWLGVRNSPHRFAAG